MGKTCLAAVRVNGRGREEEMREREGEERGWKRKKRGNKENGREN
jgi:hypothetical protein